MNPIKTYRILDPPVLGPVNAVYPPGNGTPYLRTGILQMGALPFQTSVTFETDAESPTTEIIEEGERIVTSTSVFRKEVEHRFFDYYTEEIRSEYLEYVDQPGFRGLERNNRPKLKLLC